MNIQVPLRQTTREHAYRPEIDGLRTVAIVPVVLFHAGLPAWSGGFVGVDVFFVISGYLITSILIQEFDTGSFSYWRFYERRIRRLIPPLLVMLSFTWVAATILLQPTYYEEFTRSLPSVLTAVANWFFYFQVDYFDGNALSKPLLHMWSLAIEEQFYVVFPALIILLKSRVPSALKKAIAALMIASFAYAGCLMLAGEDNTAFYNSFARFWELLVGCLLATGFGGRPSVRGAVYARYAGAIMIGIAVFGFHKDVTPFPGPAALLPVLGTALIIWAGASGSDLISNILKSEPFVRVGQASYSWYLFHWPIAVFIPLMLPEFEPYAPLPQLAGVAIGLGMAFLSLHYVESPIRHKKLILTAPGAYRLFSVGVAASFVLALPGFVSGVAAYRLQAIHGARGAVLSILKGEEDYYQEHLNRNYTGKSGPILGRRNQHVTCSFDGRNTLERLLACLSHQATERNVLVIGDSVGRDTFHSLREAFPKTNFLMLHQSSCVPADALVGKRQCFPGLLNLLDRARSTLTIDGVVLAFRYRAKEWIAVAKSLSHIRDRFERVHMIGVNPVFRTPPATYVQQLTKGESIPTTVAKADRTMIPWSYATLSADARKLADKHRVTYIDVEPVFCPGSSCLLWLGEDTAKPLFFDQFHLTRHGVTLLSTHLKTIQELRFEAR